MSSFLQETEEMCSHFLKMPSDKSHKTDHKRGRSHFVHKSFLIFTGHVQPVLSQPRCAAMPHHSAHHQWGCASKAREMLEMLDFPALMPHLLFILLFIKLNMCIFLCLFIERQQFRFIFPNWLHMWFFPFTPQQFYAAQLQSLSVTSAHFYLSHKSLWFPGLGSWCSWMLLSCSVSSFFHIRIAYHSAFVNSSFSNWQFIYLWDYLPRRHTFTCFPGLLMSAFWCSLLFFCSFHSFLSPEQWFCCFMVAFTQISF